MLIAVALLATSLAAWYGQRYWQLAADATTAPADTIKVERLQAPGKTVVGDPFRYYASFAFNDADGRRHTARQSISRSLYNELAQGSAAPVIVHYSRSRPGVNVLDLDALRTVSIVLAIIAAAAWIAALLRLVRG